MNIAVIGAGVSGLSMAYYLTNDPTVPTPPQVTVFEKTPFIGGAVKTFPLNIPGESRWADMGVNDFNAVTYTNLVGMLNKLNVPYSPLSDTTSFFTLDGSFSYTIDGQWNTTMPQSLATEYERFQTEAPLDYKNNPQYVDYTIEQYLTEKGYSADFGRYNIYPRINGMYFAHETTPNDMPFRGIMHYYILQEGFGQGTPQRQYFTNGSSSWLEALYEFLENSGNVKFVTGTGVQVFGGSDGVQVQTPDGTQQFDACVLACHADAALNAIEGGITQDMVNLLKQFEYCNSVAVAHTYTPLLPQNKSAWRTYNILIHDYFEQLRPYTISYVVNWHQNDAENPLYNRFNDPNYFVTLNPSIPIPDQYVLNVAGCDAQPAITYFPHNIVTLNAMNAQDNLLPGVQGQNGLYFAGGWTKGAGLQEECLLASQEVSSLILHGQHSAEHQYNLDPDAEHHAPKYVRDAVL